MYLFFVLNSFDFSSPQLDFTNLKVLAELSNRFFGCCIFLFLLIFNQVCLSGIFYLCTIDFFIIYVIFISVNDFLLLLWFGRVRNCMRRFHGQAKLSQSSSKSIELLHAIFRISYSDVIFKKLIDRQTFGLLHHFPPSYSDDIFNSSFIICI